METFAFIISPVTTRHFKEIWPVIRLLPDFLVKLFLKNLPPFKISQLKIKSIRKNEIEGCLIVCPLSLQQMNEAGQEAALHKIISAGQVAKKLGAKIIGLGGLASLISEKGYLMAKKLKIAVTNGNALTCWTAFEAIYRICRIKNISLKKSTLAVIGATGPLGNLCGRRCSDEVNSVILVASQKNKAEYLEEATLEINSAKVTIEEDTHQALKHADIIINTDEMPERTVDIATLKPNTIVCDVSASYALFKKAKQRKDLNVIRGGLIKLPDLQNIISAALAETMLLALENRFINYSLDNNINLDKTEEIANFAAKHGFEVWVPEAPLL